MIPAGFFAGPIAAQASPPGDPYWDDVISLLLLDEPNGSLAITDQKGVPWTREGAAAISSAQARFGSTSLHVPNATGYDGFSAPQGTIPENAPFTLEGWVYLTDPLGFNLGFSALFGQGGGLGGQDQVFGFYEGRVVWVRGIALEGGQAVAQGTTQAAANQWHHIEMGFDGAAVYVFLNGNLEGQIADTFGWINTGLAVTLGREIVIGFDSFRMGLRGYIGGTRITAACRHTASFTPPDAPFPVG